MIVRAKQRKSSGNMLICTCVFFAVNAILILLASSFGALFIEQARLQNSANEIALAGARKLNENDRIGRMNNMISRCRQLVYCSTDTHSQVDTSYTHLRYLADQLANEARESAHTVETERERLASAAGADANAAMDAKFQEIKVSYAMALPWLKVGVPTASSFKRGRIKEVESNVMEMKGFPDLESHDATQNHLKSLPDVKLYKRGDARLPGSDSTLVFRFSSLPAPVADSPANIFSGNASVAPARAVLANSFIEITGSNQISSACQIKLTLPVGTTLGASSTKPVECIGTAAATGGGLPI